MNLQKRTGITLVEMMVAVFVSTIVLTAVYGVWIRVQRQISRANAKQTLESELRAIANSMEKDFKAIKEGSFSAPPGEQNPDGTGMKVTFDRFIEGEDGKIAQDSTTGVEYHLRNGLLTRTTDSERKILSVNIDSIIIAQGVDEASLGATDLESTDEDFKAGREAKLAITISGKKRIPGSSNEIYHIEKSSLVMRDEYYRKTNKTYVSNFDLAQMNVDEVMVEDASQDANFGPDGVFILEQLQDLDDEPLRGMKATQQDLYAQAQVAFDEINSNINDTETGSDVWDTLTFWNDSEGERVDDMKTRLKRADTKAEVKEVLDDLESYAENKERTFLNRSINNFNGKSEEEQQLYKRAYNIAVQDRAIKIANEKAKEEDPDAPDSPLMIDLMTDVQDMTYEDEEGWQTVSAGQNEEARQEAENLRRAYEEINLNWMGEFGDESKEVQAYNAAKSLVNQGRSKFDTIDMRDRADENIDLIDQALRSKKN
jgi:type II secretory pathway component PulJ